MYASDKEIISELKKDYQFGGILLFKRYYRPLVTFSNLYICDLVESEDIVQDVFYRFFSNKSYNNLSHSALSAYLFKAVRNSCYNKISRDKIKFTELDELYLSSLEHEASLIAPEMIQEIKKSIYSLPEKTSIVVRMIMLESISYKDVASELNVSINTVKTLFSKGMKALRKEFSGRLLLLFLIRKSFDEKYISHIL